MHPRALVLGAFLVYAVMLAAYAKAFVHEIFGLRAYFWLIGYENGLIRRGLVGALVKPLRDAFGSTERFLAFVSGLYHAAALALLIALFGWAMAHLARGMRGPALWAGWAALLLIVASPSISNPAYNSGWLDVFLMGAGWLAFLCVRNRLYLLAGTIGFVTTFAHEVFMFFWVPAAVLMVLHALHAARAVRTGAGLAVVALAPIIAGAVIGAVENPGSVAATINGAALDEPTKRLLLGEQFQHKPSAIFKVQMDLIAAFPRNFLLSVLYAGLPAAIVALLALRLARVPAASTRGGRLVYRVGLLALGLGTASVLLVNWDLSRTASWTGFSALMMLIEAVDPSSSPEAAPAPRPAEGGGGLWLAAAGASVLALLYTVTPVVYTYFQVADYIVPRGRGGQILADSPFGRAAARAAAFYSRGHERDKAEPVPVRYSCELTSGDGVVRQGIGQSCRFRILQGGGVYGPFRRFAEGRYRATFHFAPTGECSGGRGRLEIVLGGRVRTQADVALDAPGASPDMPFTVSITDQVARNAEFRVVATDGCLLLEDVRVDRL